jgi:hypothetical protein
VWLTWLWPSLLSVVRVVNPADDPAVASGGVHDLLALEITKAGRTAAD